MAVIPYPRLQLKLTEPQALKMRFLPAIPGGDISAKVNRSGDTMTGSLILAHDPVQLLEASTKQYVDIKVSAGGVTEAVVTLVDGPTVALNASLGRNFKLLAAGNRTILAPTNAPAAGFTQKITIAHEASGGARTLALTGGAGGFRFGSDLTALTVTPSGLVDYIGAIWNQSDGFWDVVSYARGF